MKLFEKMIQQFIELNAKARRKRRLVCVLSVIVVLVTTYTMILPAITLDRSGAEEQPGMKRFTAAEQAGNKLAMAESSEDEKIASEPKNASSEDTGDEGSSGNDNSGSGENPSSGGDDNGSGDNGNGNSDNGGSDNSGSDNGDNGDSSNDGNDGNGSNGDNSGTTGDSGNTDSDGTNSGAAGTGASNGEEGTDAGEGTGEGSGAAGTSEGAGTAGTGEGTGASEGTTGTDEGLTGTAAEGETAPEGETSVIAATEEASEIIVGAPLITEETELVYEDEEKTYKVYVTFDEKAKLPVGVQLEVDEILPGGAGPAVGEGNETTFEEYAAQVEEALHLEEGSESFLRVLDIKLVDEDGHKLVIAAPVDVRIELADMDVNDETAAKTQIVHFAEKYEDGAYQLLTRVVSGSGSGSAGSGSAGSSAGAGSGNGNGSGITGAGAGSAYAGTGSAADDDEEIADTQTVSRKAKSGDTSEGDANGGAGGNGGNGSAGNATPTVINTATKDNASTIITDDTPIEITTDVVKDVEFEDGAIHFKADSFSAYAIVTGPEPVPVGYEKVTSLDQLTGNALYLSHKLENKETYFFFGNSVVTQGNRKGITKIKPASATPPANAALYYFEQVPGTSNQFYAYCYADDGVTKQYVTNIYNNNYNNLLYTDQAHAVAFTAEITGDGVITMKSGSWYWNQQGGENGARFCCYNTPGDPNNELTFWIKSSIDPDPYDLEGKTYGIMSWSGGVAGKAMMGYEQAAGGSGSGGSGSGSGSGSGGSGSGSTALEAKALTVMRTADNSDQLFVPNDADITMWTFHWAEEDTYYMSAEIDGETKYLKITTDGPKIVSEPDETCRIRVIPGSGTHEGEICLQGATQGGTGPTITFSGTVAGGFTVGGAVGSEWLKLVELSELTTDYFMTHSASKVSVSDPGVTNGSRIIVYTRIWNDTTKQYDFYAIDHDGGLIPVYESGDSIEWVSGQINTMLWNFVEYYWEGTNDPNFYYELYNQYSEKYIAPQISGGNGSGSGGSGGGNGGQILSDDTIGINLPGRRDGQYYSEILAWDEDNYSYAGLKVDGSSVESCRISEAMDFYFAIMQDLNTDDTLTTVPTVDNNLYGIEMKMKNFDTRKEMSDFLGSDAGGSGTALHQGLLSTDLVGGYPTTKGGSLGQLLSGAEDVNHLFIQSTYSGSGYFEYDSAQNFASLKGATGGDFTVYKELGTYDSAGPRNTLKHGEFFPYNDLEAGNFAVVNGQNLYDSRGPELSDDDPRKYERLYNIENGGKPVDCFFAMELGATFTMTPDGLDEWGHDIIFEFTGDDDFWLYVDDELTIDLGGIHSAVPGSVNFRTGQVMVNGRWTTLRELFKSNYKKRGHSDAEAEAYVADKFVQNAQGQWIFKPNTNHTMRIFYMERGAGASNMYMRFNLASVRPGTVQLTKELGGVDETESVLAEFPYQIFYKTESGAEYPLTNKAGGTAQDKDYVIYKDTTQAVTFRRTGFTVDNIAYDNVFLLKPGETCEISFPDDMKTYRIVECGVNTDVYEQVDVNGTPVEGTSGPGYPANRKDYGIEHSSTDDRARVKYTNEVNPHALRTMTVVKKLFKEDGVTPIPYTSDDVNFSFRLYLASEFDTLKEANMHTYHVRNSNGEYCGWDTPGQKFYSLGRTNYDDLTDAEKEAASFTTSIYGIIAKIPADHKVEIRNILAGTQFRILERSNDIPDGYSFQRYVYNGADSPAAEDVGIVDTITAGTDPHVEVRNLKGWGLRMNKEWSDASYMASRGPVYFGVFIRDAESGDLTLINDTVRRLTYGQFPQSLYWYFKSLKEGVKFDQYEIREVILSNPDPTIGPDGVVTDFGTATPVDEGGINQITGRQKGDTGEITFDYIVHYDKGVIPEDSNVRVDTVTNDRPGVVIRKHDWSGNALQGAAFKLEDDDGTLIGSFTSDDEGYITTAYLRDGVDYVLTETKAPQSYHGLQEPMIIRKNGNDLAITYEDDDYYEVDREEWAGNQDQLILTIKDRPFTFTVVKTEAQSQQPLPGVKFALHKEVTVGDVTAIDLNPMPGYEELITDENGLIPQVDNTLPAGTYELRETEPLPDYQTLSSYIQFKITPSGDVIILPTRPPDVTLTEDTETDDSIHYVITVPNTFNPGMELPETGGPGTWLLTLGGAALIAAAAAAMYIRKRN